jgi:quercetin dioxygenase-like cupin family protein
MTEIRNLFFPVTPSSEAEVFDEIFARPGVKIERIVSLGQATPEHEPMVQDTDEWVTLLAGAAGLRIEGEEETELRPGDYLFIPRGAKHWVTWTDKDTPSLWLAVHLD